MESATSKKEKDNRLVIILGVLLGISIVGNIYLLNRSKTAEGKVIEEHAQVDSLNSFKLALENDFEAMTFELDQFKGKNIQLDSLLEKANSDIAKQKQKIDKLVKENKDIDLLRRQFAEMKAIRDGYRQQIDQLIKENKELRFANINLSQEVDDLNKSKKDLSQKVELASVLKAESIDVKALREKGKGKLEVTEKAKRVSRISTTFVVAENKVAPKGERDVVLRILKPDGYVLADPNNASGSFTKEDGRSSEFTLRKKIQYNNNREEVVFDWDQLEELKAGLYISEIYLDGKLMGNYKYNLKKFLFLSMSLPTLRIPQLQDQSSLLEPYFVQKDLLRELILQLKKDFASAGVPVKLLLTRKYTFDELCETLQLAFRDKTAQQLFNVLYRIDVSEKQLYEGMPTPGIDDRLFAEIIIKRELQKVVLRKLYSSNNPTNTEE